MNAALHDYRMIWRAAAAQREPGVRVEPLTLEDLFIEVTQ
jgi:hypothetical protein